MLHHIASTVTGDPQRHQSCGGVFAVLAVTAIILLMVWLYASGRDQGRQDQWERVPTVDPESCYGLTTVECMIARDD